MMFKNVVALSIIIGVFVGPCHSAGIDVQTDKIAAAAVIEKHDYGVQPVYFSQRGTIGSYSYSIYADGSGGIYPQNDITWKNQLWRARCDVDGMDDTITCHINNMSESTNYKGIQVIHNSLGGWGVYVVGNDFPGKTALMRFDSTRPIPMDSSVNHSALLKSLLAANKVTVRAFTWPYESPVDTTFSTEGLREAVHMLQWAVQHYKL